MKQALIIFVKNPLPGKTKTRLAASIGNEQALKVYKELVKHTLLISKDVSADKFIFFSDYIEHLPFTNKNTYQYYIQNGNTLGDRIHNAFEVIFSLSYKKAVIIGTDCPGLNSEIINTAFTILAKTDVSIGPAVDGGYYLLGMRQLNSSVFKNIAWSSSSVCVDTIARCKESKLAYQLLSPLHDVDEEKDMVHFYNHINVTL